MKLRWLPFVFGAGFIVCCLFVFNRPVIARYGYQELPCSRFTENLVIPDDGSWVQICIVDLGAPEGSTVTEMNIKIVVAHPDPGQFEILLSRTDFSFTVSLPSSEIKKDGVGKYMQIHDFDGLDAAGKWILWIRDVIPEGSGRLINEYTCDLESPDELLSYNLTSQSPANCWVSLDGSWVNVSPEVDWLGSCTVTFRVSDSLKTTTGSFVVQVQPIASRIYLPTVSKQ